MKQAKCLFYRLHTVSFILLLNLQQGDIRISVNALETEKSEFYSFRKSLKGHDN